jgi:hypothetical protein
MKIRSVPRIASSTWTSWDAAKRACPDRPCSFRALLDALARAFGDLVLSGLDRKHVDADDTVEIHAEIGGVAGEVRRIRARDQRLDRNAAGVDAGAANAPRSIIATVIPAPARRRAKGGPACPAPITMAS